MDDVIAIRASINGCIVERMVSARVSLADFVRHELGLTGTHVGCEHGVCGACTVVIDGSIARSCLIFAAQIDGRSVETIEGASESGRLRTLQAAFARSNALQCGFCTPGMLLTAAEFLQTTPSPGRDEIRLALSGNLCRCTGYQAIVDAIQSAAADLQNTTSADAVR